MPTATVAPVVEYVVSNIHHDGLICVCGNTEMFEGFYPADNNGTWMNPGVGLGWDQRTIGCLNCGRAFNDDHSMALPNEDEATREDYPLRLLVTAAAGTLPGGELPDSVF